MFNNVSVAGLMDAGYDGPASPPCLSAVSQDAMNNAMTKNNNTSSLFICTPPLNRADRKKPYIQSELFPVELADMERFKTAEEIASYMGLTLSEYSTGQHVRQGRITRCGNKRARTCLVESSWHLIIKDPLILEIKESQRSKEGNHCYCKKSDNTNTENPFT